MAELAANPFHVAILNGILASQKHNKPAQLLTEEKIADLLQTMAEKEAAFSHPEMHRRDLWHWSASKSA